MNKDLYAVLGVDRTADDKKLKSAYRKLAKKYHPDANPGNKDAEQKFKDVGEAYAILSDPEKRKLYDTYGYAAFDGSGPAPGSGAGGPGGYQYYTTNGGNGFQSFHFSGQDAEDLFRSVFGDMFGSSGGSGFGGGRFSGGSGFGGFGFDDLGGGAFRGRSSRAARQQSLDLTSSLTVSFRDAALGATKRIQLQDPSATGSKASLTTLEVKIPAGIEEGKKIRLRGRGMAGADGKKGDLLIEIHIGWEVRRCCPHFTAWSAARSPQGSSQAVRSGSRRKESTQKAEFPKREMNLWRSGSQYPGISAPRPERSLRNTRNLSIDQWEGCCIKRKDKNLRLCGMPF